MSQPLSSASQVETEDLRIVWRARPGENSAAPPRGRDQPHSVSTSTLASDSASQSIHTNGRIQTVHRPKNETLAAIGESSASGSLSLPTPVAAVSLTLTDREERSEQCVDLPGSRNKKIWPLLPVAYESWSNEHYVSSFSSVINYLKDAIDRHETLRDCARTIIYNLSMVGPSPQLAKPSILVICRYTELLSLNSLFREMPRRKFNCIIPSLRDRLSRGVGLWRMSESKPILWLYPCPNSSETFNLLTGMSVNIECSSSSMTMCGSLVEYMGHQSTISLTLDIDGEDRLLTVEHLFRDGKSGKSKMSTGSKSESSVSAEKVIRDYGWFNDSEEDLPKQNDEDSSHWGSRWGIRRGQVPLAKSNKRGPLEVDREAMSSRVARVARVESHTKPILSHTLGERVKPSNSLESTSQYLDWACVRLMDYKMTPSQRCNFLVRDEQPPSLLEHVASAPRAHGVPVFMISGILGVRSGRLLQPTSYLGSSKGQALCETWVVILDRSESFLSGESGSIVVDQRTLYIYGHLIGSDMFGYGRVVPLSHTIQQIKKVFEADSVKLPILKEDILLKEDTLSQRLPVTVEGDISGVQQQLQLGVDANRPLISGAMPLSRAAENGHQDIVEHLLRAVSSRDTPGNYGVTPLEKATKEGHHSIVWMLIGEGAGIKKQHESGKTALLSPRKEQPITAKLIRSANPNENDERHESTGPNEPTRPNERTRPNEPAGPNETIELNDLDELRLWSAIQNGRYDIVSLKLKLPLLIAKARKLNWVGYRQTALLKAMHQGHRPIADLGGDLTATERSKLLIKAAQYGYLPIVLHLVEGGADVHVLDFRKQTPLFKAAKNGHLAVLNELIQAGSTVNSRDYRGQTPLYKAIKNGHQDILDQLLRAGASINKNDYLGQTPLLLAIQHKQLDILESLLGAGARVNIRGTDGMTPIFQAIDKGDLKILDKLLGAGASVNMPCISGQTPIFQAVKKGHVAMIQRLIEAGADVNLRDYNNQTPILIAARKRRRDIVWLLIEAGDHEAAGRAPRALNIRGKKRSPNRNASKVPASQKN